jgi:hypothetical protein
MVRESGLGNNFWTYEFSRVKHMITKGWVSALWEFMGEVPGLCVNRVDGLLHRPPQFSGDKFLMQLILDETDLSGSELALFNYCRIFLQVELLSDIITADGKSIRQEIWKGQTNNLHSFHRDYWPHQPRPTEKAWTIWRSVLQRLLNLTCSGKCVNVQHRIWLTQDWQWSFHESTTRLYHRSNGIIQEYSLYRNGQTQRTRQKQF